MKNIIGLLMVIVSMVLVSCEPIENRVPIGGEITMTEIDKHVKVSLEIDTVTGKSTNTLLMNADGLQALSMFDYGQGVLRGAGGTALLLNKGTHTIKYTARNANGTELTKDFTVNVEVLKGVDMWVALCGENGSKTWTWDTGRMPRSTAPGWIPDPGVNYFPVGPPMPNNPLLQQYPAEGKYATVYGLGIWRVHTYPQLHQVIKEGVDSIGSAVLKPMPANYFDPAWDIRYLTGTTNPTNEGVLFNATGAIEKIATMTFSVTNGLVFKKQRINADNTVVEGNFRLDPAGGRQMFDVPGEKEPDVRWYDQVWSQGQVILSGPTGTSVLSGGRNLTYNIIKLTADEMVLAVRAGGSWGDAGAPLYVGANDNIRCFIWVFKPYNP
jgi:hypothetical protein